MGNWSLLVAAVYNLFRLFRAASAALEEGGGGRGADKKILRRQIKHTGGDLQQPLYSPILNLMANAVMKEK